MSVTDSSNRVGKQKSENYGMVKKYIWKKCYEMIEAFIDFL